MRRTTLSGVALGLIAALIAVFALVGGATAGDGHDHLAARLTGEKEVPGPGDPDGSGKAAIEVFPQKGHACFHVEWDRIKAPTAAHIHFGGPDVAGPVVVTLFMSSASPDQPPALPHTIHGVKGCSDEVAIPEGAPFTTEAALLRNIKRNPHDYYVNVHNLDYPAGAIRGQLH